MEPLKIASKTMNIALNPKALMQFEVYYKELLDWNQKFNLTAISQQDEVISKHFLDSLSCLTAIPQLPKSVVDVGTGAGLPGIALKIAQPHIHLSLVEATGKKIQFLHHIVDKLGLDTVTILHNRAEEVGRLLTHRGHYDLAVARAVAQINVLAEYMLPLLKEGGLMLAQKGVDPTTEIQMASNALGILGGRYQKTMAVSIPNLKAERHLVLIKKIKPTPKQYPRRVGMPAKKPIR